VLYCYQLQVVDKHVGKGLGTKLMNLIESLCIKYEMRQVTLTVFKSNQTALNFYSKRGYKIDSSCPSNHLGKERQKYVSYFIMSHLPNKIQ
jgi:ribosomal protein S18 acetylase RimI-like enzyme